MGFPPVFFLPCATTREGDSVLQKKLILLIYVFLYSHIKDHSAFTLVESHT